MTTLSRGQELERLVGDLSRALETARRLGLSTTVYLLSMALAEVREALDAASDGGDDDSAA
ncbi:hypothetical protein [Bradyrhizobium iriomotense]|uniref:Uncharacterized protein n=1 Tax=Bradyrhizobium iriomotense TaxID=441950 RepID=A0ABQ6B9C9_9BRAD|nr:hypothetical protein [Bradyrhizobium iriomotense]GLR88712.1 hypothetical protein GCM10007857_54250 [Bradyrhizobium iriomotense]